MRIIARLAIGVVVAVLLLYAGDVAWLRLRLARHADAIGSVEVQVLVAVPLKNGRTEYIPGDTENDQCVRALFPQLGLPPCWYLQRHTTKRLDL